MAGVAQVANVDAVGCLNGSFGQWRGQHPKHPKRPEGSEENRRSKVSQAGRPDLISNNYQSPLIGQEVASQIASNQRKNYWRFSKKRFTASKLPVSDLLVVGQSK